MSVFQPLCRPAEVLEAGKLHPSYLLHIHARGRWCGMRLTDNIQLRPGDVLVAVIFHVIVSKS